MSHKRPTTRTASARWLLAVAAACAIRASCCSAVVRPTSSEGSRQDALQSHQSVRALLSAGEHDAALAGAVSALRRGVPDILPHATAPASSHQLTFSAAAAAHALGSQALASRLFAAACVSAPRNLRAWLNLGETLLFRLLPVPAALAFDGAMRAGLASMGLGPDPALPADLAAGASAPACGRGGTQGDSRLWPGEPCYGPAGNSAAAVASSASPSLDTVGTLSACAWGVGGSARGRRAACEGAPVPPSVPRLSLTAASKWAKARRWAGLWEGLEVVDGAVGKAIQAFLLDPARWGAGAGGGRISAGRAVPAAGGRLPDPPVSAVDDLLMGPVTAVACTARLSNNAPPQVELKAIVPLLMPAPPALPEGGQAPAADAGAASGRGSASLLARAQQAALQCARDWSAAAALGPPPPAGASAAGSAAAVAAVRRLRSPLGGGAAAWALRRVRTSAGGPLLLASPAPVAGRQFWPHPVVPNGSVPLWSLARAVARSAADAAPGRAESSSCPVTAAERGAMLHSRQAGPSGRRSPLRVALVSSDFGVHPVSSLLAATVAQWGAGAGRHGKSAPGGTEDAMPRRRGHGGEPCVPSGSGGAEAPGCEAAGWRRIRSGGQGGGRALPPHSSSSSSSSPRVVVAAFALQPASSWWGRLIASTSSHFTDLGLLGAGAQAAAVASWRPDVVLELNGHTLGSGLPLASLALAPVTAGYLGFAGTTASAGVSHILSDAVATPAEHSSHFSERLALVNGCFFASSYAALQRHVPKLPRASWLTALSEPTAGGRGDADEDEDCVPGDGERLSGGASAASPGGVADAGRCRSRRDATAGRWKWVAGRSRGRSRGRSGGSKLRGGCSGGRPTVLAVFSNFQKMDAGAAAAWAAAMRALPCAVLWVIRHDGHETALPALRAELAARGVGSWRIVDTGRVAWIDHVRTKSAADMVLDTRSKNGHTSVADALWAGVPVLTLAGPGMGQRVAKSLLLAASGGGARAWGVTHSLKEYTLVAVAAASREHGRSLLGAARRRLAGAAAGGRPGDAQLWDVQGQAGRLQRCLSAMAEATAASQWLMAAVESAPVGEQVGSVAGLPPHVWCGPA